ncbi:peptide/nickel transport system permease protein [Roseovarius nanhaiticus]|uniref:Peptide/nickel transport system permease protein n=1 Tax=Roseovarius nanhaiticus TaxID=573024 RepID=A0A1N7ES71_9RHOB|nr:ABC transporter permease [Roseovarius nanhaiticus]SEK67781.1 peptide/nickel transport system permease protein [Roseovarius nanhaiticus]SIR90874.1 peptide/nickel transport system permease protein [Roseovarius nanhaiticus]
MRLFLYLLPRLAAMIVTLLGVSVLVFLSLRMIPGGYADILLGPFVTPAAREAISQQYGLDQPLVVQYLRWLAALLQGDFGVSMVTRQPVLDEFIRRAPVTLELAMIALGLALSIGLPLGVWSGIRQGGRRGVDFARLVGALGASVPDFVLGSVLIFVFSVWSLWFRVGGYVPFGEDPVGNMQTMLLPALTLSLFGIALVLRTTRDAVLRVMTEGYITAAVARGERPRDIVRLHILRNAAIPVVTVVTTYFGFLLGGAVVVEVLFSVPGFGLYIFNGLLNRDYAIVQAGVLLAATAFVAINMLADFLYAVIDPRVGAD